MRIRNLNQFNQGIGKYKLLSSTSGVGSIITTKIGSYVLISDINKWRFIKWANARIEALTTKNTDERNIYDLFKTDVKNRNLEFIDDKRFIHFIKQEKELKTLMGLIGIPHMSLHDVYNTPNWKKHPINAALEKAGEHGKPSDFMIGGSLFPKWFKNRNGELKLITEWENMWNDECRKHEGAPSKSDFAPPRDATDFIRSYKIKNSEGKEETFKEYRILDQTNLILICPNGHLSDIPWSRYLEWKTLKESNASNSDEQGETLFESSPCCSSPKLIWSENRTKSEGYGSIYIHCEACGTGDGGREGKKKKNDFQTYPKITLEGINSLTPCCAGQKPWERELEPNRDGNIPFEKCFDNKGDIGKMQISLVTANNVYYANGFSSLFIPMHLAKNKPIFLVETLVILEERYNRRNSANPLSKEDFWETRVSKDFDGFIDDNGIQVPSNVSTFESDLKIEFLNIDDNQGVDLYEEYRWQEYRCFAQNPNLVYSDENKGLNFSDIVLPSELQPFFSKIQQVEELRITNVQLDFTRVKPKERIVRLNDNNERIVTEATLGQNIYSVPRQELFVLPANESLGEGLFFQFNDTAINEWLESNANLLNERFSKFLERDIDDNLQGAATMRKIQVNGIKHFLIHGFSHMMMRELEFSCGYPTASLKERLYISNSAGKIMSGVLIYTAEGSEGSMGGLVSQGESQKILEVLLKGLERSINCSSDPLCWESEGQGIFDLNLSACFSCSLVSETACEEMNLGLDRRVLVDENYGYFDNLLGI